MLILPTMMQTLILTGKLRDYNFCVKNIDVSTSRDDPVGPGSNATGGHVSDSDDEIDEVKIK